MHYLCVSYSLLQLLYILLHGQRKPNPKPRSKRAPKPKPVSTMTEEQRAIIQRRVAFVGMILAFTGIVLHIVDMSFTSSCLAGLDQDLLFSDVGRDVLKMLLALFSLLINIVNFKSGGYDDCGSLRMMLMMSVCLWWCRYIKSCHECYHKFSVKLLIGFNSLLWIILFVLDLESFIEENNARDSAIIAFDNSLVILKYVKLMLVILGLIQSQAFLLWKLCGRACKVLVCCGKIVCIALACCCCCVIVIVIIIIAAVAASGPSDSDSNRRRLQLSSDVPTISPTMSPSYEPAICPEPSSSAPTECPISVQRVYRELTAPPTSPPYHSYPPQ